MGTFDLTPFIARVGKVQNQEIDDTNNFEAYIGKIKASVDTCRKQFGMAREFCGQRDGYDACKHPVTCNHPANRASGVMIFCKLEICPFLK